MSADVIELFIPYRSFPTAESLFLECARLARDDPAAFETVMVIFKKDGFVPLRYDFGKNDIGKAVGMLECIKAEVLKEGGY